MKHIYSRFLICIVLSLVLVSCEWGQSTAVQPVIDNSASATQASGAIQEVQTQEPQSTFTSTVAPVENYPGVIGWEADKYGVIAYYDGSFYVRDGKNTRFKFGIFNDPPELEWYNSEGYLPCLVTEFEQDKATVMILNFGDEVTVDGETYVAIYSRVSITNHSLYNISLAPAPSEGLIPLTETALTIKPGTTVFHDYVVAADRFGNQVDWPSDDALAAAGSWDAHYAHMKEYWNSRLNGIVNITQLPDARLINAYKAGFIYTHIIRDGDDLHVGENGYDKVFDHDSVGILTTLFALGDFTYAKPLLSALQAQTQYDDAKYKNSWVWALYLLKTGDTTFVRNNFDQIKSNTHKIEADRTGPDGILKMTNDIDANGYWTIDGASALFGLTTYQYLANRLGEADEAAWARDLYSSLLADINKKLTQTMSSGGIDYLPCDLTKPNNANRCRDSKDANWASMLLFGRWYWEGYLWGADQSGPMLDGIDATYAYGFTRLLDLLPEHTYGGYPGYSTGYNTGYGHSGLRGTQYRSEAIYGYQFMLDYTQSSPFGWWENISEPEETPWEGTHPLIGYGSCPHMWGQSFATAGLLDSLIVEKSDGTILVGRGVPNAWVSSGQVIKLSNYPISENKRMGIVVEGLPGNQVRLTLTGDAPGANVVFNLPIFINNIKSATAGTVDNPSGTVTLESDTTSVTVILIATPASSAYP